MSSEDELVDDLCAPCRNADHARCRTDLGCQCWGRWSPDERGVVLCESLDAKERP